MSFVGRGDGVEFLFCWSSLSVLFTPLLAQTPTSLTSPPHFVHMPRAFLRMSLRVAITLLLINLTMCNQANEIPQQLNSLAILTQVWNPVQESTSIEKSEALVCCRWPCTSPQCNPCPPTVVFSPKEASTTTSKKLSARTCQWRVYQSGIMSVVKIRASEVQTVASTVLQRSVYLGGILCNTQRSRRWSPASPTGDIWIIAQTLKPLCLTWIMYAAHLPSLPIISAGVSQPSHVVLDLLVPRFIFAFQIN